MKKQTVKVSLEKPTNSLKHKLIFHKDGNTVFVNKSKVCRTIPSKEYFDILHDDPKKISGLDIMNVEFRSSHSQGNDGKYLIKCTEILLSTNGKEEDKGLIEFFTKCPLSNVDGHHNSANVIFKVENVEKQKELRYNDHQNKIEIINHLSTMSEDKLLAVMDFFGRDTSDKTKPDILLELSDMDNGILFATENGNSNSDTFKNFFMKDDNGLEGEKDVMIAVNKGIRTGVIHEVHGTNGGYYYKDIFVGLDIKEVKTKFRTDAKLLGSLKSMTKSDAPIVVDTTKTEALSKGDMMKELRGLLKSDKNPEGRIDLEGKNLITLSVEELTKLYNEHVK